MQNRKDDSCVAIARRGADFVIQMDQVSICFKMVVVSSCLKQTIRNLIRKIIPMELQTIVMEFYKTRKPSEDQNM